MRHVACLAALALVASAAAHDTWLLPERAAIPAKTDLRLDLTSGMEFPELDHPIKPDRVEAAGGRLVGKPVELVKSASDKSLRFQAVLADPGIAVLWVALKPRKLELNEKQVAEYLDEIAANDAVRKAWADAGKDRRWREIYTKHAKTFVRVGEPGRDLGWAGPVGLGLEIVPQSDPTSLTVGGRLSVRVLKGGKPLARFPLGAVCDGKDMGKPKVTDKDGRVEFQLATAGRWLVRGTELRPSKQDGVDWESDFTTMTFDVTK